MPQDADTQQRRPRSVWVPAGGCVLAAALWTAAVAAGSDAGATYILGFLATVVGAPWLMNRLLATRVVAGVRRVAVAGVVVAVVIVGFTVPSWQTTTDDARSASVQVPIADTDDADVSTIGDATLRFDAEYDETSIEVTYDTTEMTTTPMLDAVVSSSDGDTLTCPAFKPWRYSGATTTVTMTCDLPWDADKLTGAESVDLVSS
ncbi:hypothetical protein [Curtobacterium sp. PhB130]|uniref:hypothetical protein n=1 Tax=Curtobacterium sp. PhB130 TaxID=2485178 RepID=UPI0011CDF2B1|nr:hypothetical protein [Curtobacterium sp. PhB130]